MTWRLNGRTNSLGVSISTTWFTWPGSSATNFFAAPINQTNPSEFFCLTYP